MLNTRELPRKFDEDYKKLIAKLHESSKSQNSLVQEYDIAVSSIIRWGKQYSEVQIDSETS